MAFSRTYDGDEPVRINKWLGQTGVCSRREADALIADGLVSVDGAVVTDAGRKLEPWDLHGCRHGVRTALRGQRLCTKEIAERIINHSSGGIDERYDHNLYLDEKREALERWEARLLSEVAKQEGTNIVMLRESG